MAAVNYLIFLFFGLAPSIIWLLFYLRKDAHPEPNRMILKIFFWGMLIAIPAVFIEIVILALLKPLPFPALLLTLLYIFLGVALVEEVLKYLVVRYKVFHHPALDEPVDIMLYMIIAALGFAALENLIILFGLGLSSAISQVVVLTGLRFVGATFLHALASGAFGYFISGGAR